ncbi:MAG TPA: galactose oxidase-like domain-containing protein [Acidimicrobiales bacterium]|nr:galactose oxidase-like domain-containing protein [Acidimicrobiales bacterium]
MGQRSGLVGVAALVVAGVLATIGPVHASTLPPGPQLGGLPVPDFSQTPAGLPTIPGLTVAGPISGGPAALGAFGVPFSEPGADCPQTNGSTATCKPAAVNVVVLPNGKVLYWNGLEGEEGVNLSLVAEGGDTLTNDQTRLLSLAGGTPSWSTPSPADGGGNGSAYTEYLLPGMPAPLDAVFNSPGSALGALFCADQVLLADGRVLTPGGTHWYAEPSVPGTGLGVAELEGLRETRIYNPATNTWSQSGRMNYGRWYPSLVTMPDGKVFVASGVTKLLKPLYPGHPMDSGTNVRQTETYDPVSGTWSDNGAGAARSLPLYPRLHLLPDGNVYYDGGGQTFNPMGEAYDEPTWNLTALYNPSSRAWRSLTVPIQVWVDTPSHVPAITAGFRGSSFSVMLPLAPPYSQASFLSAGGVLGTTPGAYFATQASTINTIDTAAGDRFNSAATSPLVNARWFSTAVALPTGQVMAFSGANRDDTFGPATSFAVTQAELFDPATKTWTAMASGHKQRTYHNSAVLLPSGEVLVGGHAPISALYSYNTTLPGGFNPNFRDPTFEIYKPPYLFWGPRPAITSVGASMLGYGQSLALGVTTGQPGPIESVMLVRNAAMTHLVDGDQRSIVLPITSRTANGLTVSTPPTGAVAPPGPYLLFVNQRTSQGLVPSIAAQVFVR